mmetsp:Transcript_23832/g.69807  ORF Transcript_23832/g.69807 Transcript_23832/m.69807 type:complete len:356 (+) Transcript_23832:1122-2189(+)
MITPRRRNGFSCSSRSSLSSRPPQATQPKLHRSWLCRLRPRCTPIWRIRTSSAAPSSAIHSFSSTTTAPSRLCPTARVTTKPSSTWSSRELWRPPTRPRTAVVPPQHLGSRQRACLLKNRPWPTRPTRIRARPLPCPRTRWSFCKPTPSGCASSSPGCPRSEETLAPVNLRPSTTPWTRPRGPNWLRPLAWLQISSSDLLAHSECSSRRHSRSSSRDSPSAGLQRSRRSPPHLLRLRHASRLLVLPSGREKRPCSGKWGWKAWVTWLSMVAGPLPEYLAPPSRVSWTQTRSLSSRLNVHSRACPSLWSSARKFSTKLWNSCANRARARRGRFARNLQASLGESARGMLLFGAQRE